MINAEKLVKSKATPPSLDAGTLIIKTDAVRRTELKNKNYAALRNKKCTKTTTGRDTSLVKSAMIDRTQMLISLLDDVKRSGLDKPASLRYTCKIYKMDKYREKVSCP